MVVIADCHQTSPIFTIHNNVKSKWMKPKIVVLTGAGISAESGVKTFRDQNGLWEGHDVMEVATPEGFAKNPDLVYDFYNARRKQLKSVEPNDCHYFLAHLEADFEVHVITQNVDDLHERAGSHRILHLHGELIKVRSLGRPYKVYEWREDLDRNHRCENGYGLRPHIVWFGEPVPMIEPAVDLCSTADLCIIIGTSLQVYPAAGLMNYLPSQTPILYIDPKAKLNLSHRPPNPLHCIEESAVRSIPQMKEFLNQFFKN